MAVCAAFSVGCHAAASPAPPPAASNRGPLPPTAASNRGPLPEECRDPIQSSDDRDRRLLAAMAARCTPFDRCVLLCEASRCGEGVASGCVHLCGGQGFGHDDPNSLDGVNAFREARRSGRCPR